MFQVTFSGVFLRRPSLATVVALSLLALSTLAAPAGAQMTELQPGARVRVQAPGIVAGRYVGTVLTRTADTVELGAPGAAPIKVPLARVTSVEVSRGSSRALGALRGVEWGAPIGLVFGVVAASTTEDPYCWDYCSTSGSYKAGIIAASTLAGALWGAGIGALVGRERWERFDVASRSSFDVRSGRMRVGFAVAF
jgi:hypothetical protein